MIRQRNLSRAEVTDLIAIEDAFVPIISFDYRGVSIDLLFARLAENTVPKDIDILDDRILIGKCR
jgi:poly(A) polymerase